MTSPTINTSDILARQQATLLTNSQNIVKPAIPGSSTTFFDKVNTFIDKAAPVVYKVQDIANQVQTRVPGTNLVYNPQLKYQQQQPQQGGGSNGLVIAGLVILTGFVIYKAVKN